MNKKQAKKNQKKKEMKELAKPQALSDELKITEPEPEPIKISAEEISEKPEETKDSIEMEAVVSSLNIPAAIEAILFTMGQSVSREQIETALGLSKKDFDYYITVLQNEYEKSNHGLQIIQLENAYQICTKGEYYDALIKIATTPVKPVLTPIMLEVLSIVAYKQPVTRSEIERIRGVSSDYSINRLVEYGLIQEAGHLEAPGRPILFETTEEFLRKFGLSTLGELPPVDEELMREVASEIYREHGMIMEGQLSLKLTTNEEGEPSVEAPEGPIEVDT